MGLSVRRTDGGKVFKLQLENPTEGVLIGRENWTSGLYKEMPSRIQKILFLRPFEGRFQNGP